MIRSTLLVSAAAALASALAGMSVAQGATGRVAQSMLEAHAVDYAESRSARSATFGVVIGEAAWTILAQDGPGAGVTVSVLPGAPSIPAFVVRTDSETMSAIHVGDVSPLNAMAEGDAAPARMRIETVNGLRAGSAEHDAFRALASRFFTLSEPEVTQFGADTAVLSQGAYAAPAFAAASAHGDWVRIAPGQHLNADPVDQVSGSDTVFVVTAGEAAARIDGRKIAMAAGVSVHVPAGAPHEVWNPTQSDVELLRITVR